MVCRKILGGMREGIVGIDEMTSLVPQQAKDKVEEMLPVVKEKGNALVFAGPLKDQQGEERLLPATRCQLLTSSAWIG